MDRGVAFAQGTETLIQIVSEVSLGRLLVSMIHQGFSIKASVLIYLLSCGQGSFGSLTFGLKERIQGLLSVAFPYTDLFTVI